MGPAKAKARAVSMNDAEIDAELRDFLTDRAVWPSYAEFVTAGQRRLRELVTKHGGARYWAERVGVAWIERRPGYAPRWTPERVRSELEHSWLAGRCGRHAESSTPPG